MTDHEKLETAARALVCIYEFDQDLGEVRPRLRILEIIGIDLRAALAAESPQADGKPRFFVGDGPFDTQILERVKGGPINGGVTYLQMRHTPDIDFVCAALNEKLARERTPITDLPLVKARRVSYAAGQAELGAGIRSAMQDSIDDGHPLPDQFLVCLLAMLPQPEPKP